MNKLYYGDNLHVLRDRKNFPDECVDLIYLDPPFNSKRDYNLLFKSPKGRQSEAQIEAFKDTWHWGPQVESEFDEVVKGPNTVVAGVMAAFMGFVGRNDMMAYLTMMANRLLELRRVLKESASYSGRTTFAGKVGQSREHFSGPSTAKKRTLPGASQSQNSCAPACR